MFSNYFKIALRSLWKNRIYSSINIIGLAIGIAASALILLFVSHEYSFDQFHKNGDRLYRVLGKIKWGENQIQTNAVSTQFGPSLKENSDEVVNFTRTRQSRKIVIQSDADHRFFEENFHFADSSLFSMFSFDIIKGNRASLANPGTVIITDEVAKKYFGNDDPMGKILTYDKTQSFEVVGVMHKAPSNSSLQFDFIGSFSSLEVIPEEKASYIESSVTLGSYITYVQVKSEKSAALINQMIPKLLSDKSGDQTFQLESFTAIHLNNDFGNNPNTKNIKIFLFIALLILSLALVNYVNLTTARGTLRAKEVGIRKTIGAKRGALSTQFYFESALTTIIAFAIALILIQTFTPIFLQVIQQDIDRSFLRSQLFVGLVLGLLVICTMLSGGYPALVLSQFKPVDVLKGKLSGNSNGTWLRKGFIVFQFTASIALIICSLVVQDQLSFMQNKNIGLDKENVMVVGFDQDLKNNFSSVKEEIKGQSFVSSAAVSSLALYSDRGTNAFFTETPTTHEQVMIGVLSVDKDFFKTLGIDWLKKETDSIKSGDLVINEAALEKLKITKDNLGVDLKMGDKSSQLKAIVKDFNYASLQHPVNAMVISVEQDTASNLSNRGGSLYIRLNSKAPVSESVAAIKKIYTKYSNTPFHFYFLDEAFNNLYQSEDRFSMIIKIFTGIAIFIACLGLFGLITFSTERKMKEIGIRKVLGASVTNILAMISREFLVLMALSLIVAAPIAWWAMSSWLEKFSYHIEIPIIFIALAGVMTLAFALTTICFQAFKAAVSNPVDSLKNE